MEYTIDVQTAGKYDMSFRYASGNSSGGGPFYFEIDGKKISQDISVPNSNDWDNWVTKTVSNIELNKGVNKLQFEDQISSFFSFLIFFPERVSNSFKNALPSKFT